MNPQPTRPQPKPCTCPAYAFPHRAGSGECGRLAYCEHGTPRGEERCAECLHWEAVDAAYDRSHDR